MTRIAVSLFTMFAMVALVAGATYAVFRDRDTIPGHRISTARVHVNIDAVGEARAGVAAKPLLAENIPVGQWSDWFRGAIHNRPDSGNVRLFMHVANVRGEACDRTRLHVTTGHAGTHAGERQFDVYRGSLLGIRGEANRREITGHVFTAPRFLPSNTTAVIQQRAQITRGEGTCTWDEVFTAESI
jgi:hypothetical protein